MTDGVSHADRHAARRDEVSDLRREVTDEVSVQDRVLRRVVLLNYL